MCSKYAHQILGTLKEHSDWAITLLTGVYGDNAKNMRYGKPRSSNLKSFSHSFVNVAKYHYRKWLESFTLENTGACKYNFTQVENLVNSFPTYLSKRCIDMNGPRIKNRDTSNEQSQQKQPNVNRKKRSYQRRGCLLQLQQSQQLQLNQESIATLQQLQNQEQHLEQLNTPALLSEPGCSNWPALHNEIYGPQGPAAIPACNNSYNFSVPEIMNSGTTLLQN